VWAVPVDGVSLYNLPELSGAEGAPAAFNVANILVFLVNIIICLLYRGADKSLVRPWKEISYSDQELEHYTKILVISQLSSQIPVL